MSFTIDYFKFREMDRNPNYPESYKNMKSPSTDMKKQFEEYFAFKDIKYIPNHQQYLSLLHP